MTNEARWSEIAFTQSATKPQSAFLCSSPAPIPLQVIQLLSASNLFGDMKLRIRTKAVSQEIRLEVYKSFRFKKKRLIRMTTVNSKKTLPQDLGERSLLSRT